MIHYAICWSSLCSSILIIWTCSQIFQIDCAHKQLHHLITCHCFSIKAARICEGWTKLFSKLHWQITFVCTKFGQYTAENLSVIANYKLSNFSKRKTSEQITQGHVRLVGYRTRLECGKFSVLPSCWVFPESRMTCAFLLAVYSHWLCIFSFKQSGTCLMFYNVLTKKKTKLLSNLPQYTA